MNSTSMDKSFHALASGPRRKILDIVSRQPGCNVNAVCKHFDVSRVAIMKHLNVLEEAGLLISEKHGRSRKLFFNAVPIQMIYERWTDQYSAMWAGKLTAFKQQIEDAS